LNSRLIEEGVMVRAGKWVLAAVVILFGTYVCDSGNGGNGTEESADQVGQEDLPVDCGCGEGGDGWATLDAPAGDGVQGGEDDSRSIPVDDEPPVADLSSIVPWSAIPATTILQGTWSDNVGIVKAEYLIDGVVAGEIDPVGKVLETSGQEPGDHDLAFKLYDAAGNVMQTEPVKVVLQGNGQFLKYTDVFLGESIPGWGMYEQSVPENATSVYDVKGHVTMPAGMGRALVYLKWDAATVWDLGFDIGTGNCPDSGQKLASDDLKAHSGVILIDYMDPKYSKLKEGKWFAHIRFTDGASHKGETIGLNSLFLVAP